MWAPARRCLIEMLESTFFEVLEDTYSEIDFDTPEQDTGRLSIDKVGPAQRDAEKRKIGRAAIVAVARNPGGRNEKFETEMKRTYRNPGLDLRRLGW